MFDFLYPIIRTRSVLKDEFSMYLYSASFLRRKNIVQTKKAVMGKKLQEISVNSNLAHFSICYFVKRKMFIREKVEKSQLEVL